MPDNWYASRARVMTGLIESVSLYGSVCLSVGGLASLASHAVGANPLLWFTAGFSLPIGPLYLYLASDRVLERRLIRWKPWKEQGLIGAGQYEQLRRDALAWYQARHRFGPTTRSEPTEPTSDSPPLPHRPSPA